eukprot:Rhum_TRINITY_DN6990_c0_g1::Rhum_TRINITY_DN6990_c0_g1_i1::g.21432::m.21432
MHGWVLPFAATVAAVVGADVGTTWRTPSTPVAVQDPYASFWSAYDELNGGWLQRWNGKEVQATGLLRVDGACFVWLGKSVASGCTNAKQASRTITATSTTYVFTAGKVQATVRFTTPAVLSEPLDYNITTLPMTYITVEAVATDAAEHSASLYLDLTGDATVISDSTEVTWKKVSGGGFEYLSIGAEKQAFCYSGEGSNGCADNINFGYANLGYAANAPGLQAGAGVAQAASQAAFAAGHPLPSAGTPPKPVRGSGGSTPVNAVVQTLTVAAVRGGAAPATLYLGYDEHVAAMGYFGTLLPAYWTRLHGSYLAALQFAGQAQDKVLATCDGFDKELWGEMTAVGGVSPEYAALGALAWRQVTGATKTTWNPVLEEIYPFMKEISSDGDVSTVDVLFPAAPLFLRHAPEYLRKLLVPVLEYAQSDTFKYGKGVWYNRTYAPHHLGTWPNCYLPESKQENMPVEETGNLILMITGIAKKQQSTAWLKPYWGLLQQYGDYLVSALPDPGNQLCTDDFEGPSPHNANLAIKGIVALSAYSELLTMKNDTVGAAIYKGYSEKFAADWYTDAIDVDGTHTKLQYNLNKTWSMKYNIAWQYFLDLKVVPDAVVANESAYYIGKANEYGVPLDDRKSFAKHDWSFWVASMGSATGDNSLFNLVVARTVKFLQNSPNRVPWSDWDWTITPDVRGFRARPVLGGIWAQMLVKPE